MNEGKPIDIDATTSATFLAFDRDREQVSERGKEETGKEGNGNKYYESENSEKKMFEKFFFKCSTSFCDYFQMSDYHPPHHNESCRTLTLPRSIASHRDLLDKVNFVDEFDRQLFV